MSLFKLKDYVSKSENDEKFVTNEIEMFAKHLPALSEVIIQERDMYISQTIYELVNIVLSRLKSSTADHGKFTRAVVVVVGAGHLKGIQQNLSKGAATEQKMHSISSSSVHNSTWPGSGYLHIVDTKLLFPDL